MIALTSPALPRTTSAPRPGAGARTLDAAGRLLLVAAARLTAASAARHERRARRTAAARLARHRTADDHRRDNAAQVHPLGLR